MSETPEEKIDRILTMLETVTEDISVTRQAVMKVVEEVKPTLDSLMQTPLFKVLGGKRK